MSSWFFEPLHLWRYIILQCLWLMHQKKFLGRARWKSPTTEAATQGMSHRADTRVCQLSWSSENHELCVRICFEGPESEPMPQQSQMHVTQEKQLTRQSTTFKNIPPPNWIIISEIILKNTADLLSKRIQLSITSSFSGSPDGTCSASARSPKSYGYTSCLGSNWQTSLEIIFTDNWWIIPAQRNFPEHRVTSWNCLLF